MSLVSVVENITGFKSQFATLYTGQITDNQKFKSGARNSLCIIPLTEENKIILIKNSAGGLELPFAELKNTDIEGSSLKLAKSSVNISSKPSYKHRFINTNEEQKSATHCFVTFGATPKNTNHVIAGFDEIDQLVKEKTISDSITILAINQLM